ncbi:3-methyl-2-oxobutanoate hydroxymethyltransferase [Alienimonas californiensis]|uniref:3-methyl-2-oxobutanoate hydroxymethyltransferase n=1 Tax=Alienimonas californiensis TaxID=2527989 RepID=A0A517PBY6_9PLAN|nr:3-methyl-2-oxobutanoate hydroxymethyltransferase [Alienimonas californiensis]QDT16869.1 3-methyl-2-oxobutanoate hydroxymethyltransferase [Alienimonas californiensis]
MTDSDSTPAGPASGPRTPMTLPRFVAAKSAGRKLAVLTAYDALTARLFEEAGVDALLVGDTVGVVVQGHATTLPVTVEQIVYHTAAVVRGRDAGGGRAMVIADLPFLSYQTSVADAVRNAGRMLKEGGAGAVKLEGGGVDHGETIAAIAAAGVPVMAHIGLKPQSVHAVGGHRVQRDVDALVADAVGAEAAGAFAIVLELVNDEVAQAVTRAVGIPTIGIGAGPHCDGQVLVGADMLGLNPGFAPKFLKKYADLGSETRRAAAAYCEEVRGGAYPAAEHTHR